MKKIIVIVLVTVFCLFVSCSSNVTVEEIITFDEKIVDNTIEIDGIQYDIDKTVVQTFKYADGVLIEKNIEHQDDSTSQFTYFYDNDLLVKEEIYSNNILMFSKLYIYENGKEVKSESVTPDGVTAYSTETTYNGNSKEVRTFLDDMTLSTVESFELNDKNQSIGMILTIPNTDIKFKWSYEYENENMVHAHVERNDGNTGDIHYQYNNVNDLISDYEILYGDKINLFAKFYDNEYNEELELVRQVIYEVKSEIDEKNIRKY